MIMMMVMLMMMVMIMMLVMIMMMMISLEIAVSPVRIYIVDRTRVIIHLTGIPRPTQRKTRHWRRKRRWLKTFSMNSPRRAANAIFFQFKPKKTRESHVKQQKRPEKDRGKTSNGKKILLH